MAVDGGPRGRAVAAPTRAEVLGVNDKRAARRSSSASLQRRAAEALMDAGVTLADPARIDVRGDARRAGATCAIDVGCVFEGDGRARRRRARSARTACCATCAIGAGTRDRCRSAHIDGADDRRRAAASARTRGCGPGASSPTRCTSATSSR
ncbi:MAG: hypothetical protein MZW92_50665 [Comamonadaceae bacterium]|nr:hypothetical protein [Comamonadaceae bacterium]